MKKLLLITLLASVSGVSQAADQAPHWSYADSKEWGALAPAFAECKLGKAQSPIDIQTKQVRPEKLSPIKPSYKSSKAEVINNGHTIQVSLDDGGMVSVPSGSYRLIQFHFHTPSEEKINGKNFPLVAHLVHQNSEGKLAVVAVMFKEGKDNPALVNIFAQMPSKEGKVALSSPFDPSILLPSNLAYYAFSGSLTTPPCSEGVAWQVLKNPVEVSKAQLEAFRKVFKMNARPVQPLNGRVVLGSE